MRILMSISLLLLFSTHGLSQSQTSSSDAVQCVADVRWLNTTGSLNHARSLQLPEELSFMVHLGRGTGCSSAEVTLTATYLSDGQEFICSGTIRSAMKVTSQVQTFNMSVRPFTQLDFVRWRNEPGARGEQQGKRLPCLNLDGTSDVGDTDRQKAGWMRLSVGVFPSNGGLAVTETIFRFVP